MTSGANRAATRAKPMSPIAIDGKQIDGDEKLLDVAAQQGAIVAVRLLEAVPVALGHLADRVVERAGGQRDRSGVAVVWFVLLHQAADRQQRGMAEAAVAGERLVAELVTVVDRRDALGSDLEVEADRFAEDLTLAALGLSQPRPAFLVEVVGQRRRRLDDQASDMVAYATGTGRRRSGDELVGRVDLMYRDREEMADDLVVHEQQSFGTRVGREPLDVALVLLDRAPFDELPQCSDEVAALARRVAQLHAGFEGGTAHVVNQVREQDLLTAGEQRRDDERQVRVRARRPRRAGAAPQCAAAPRPQAALVQAREPGLDDEAIAEKLAQLHGERGRGDDG